MNIFDAMVQCGFSPSNARRIIAQEAVTQASFRKIEDGYEYEIKIGNTKIINGILKDKNG